MSAKREGWQLDCVESACYDILPSGHPNQYESKTVTWQEVHQRAKQFDGFVSDGGFVRELLETDGLDTVKVQSVEGGYQIEKDIGNRATETDSEPEESADD